MAWRDTSFTVPLYKLLLSIIEGGHTIITKEVYNLVGFFFVIIKSKEVTTLYDILKSALQTKYGMSRKEIIDLIDKAKEQGKLLELYECAMLKLQMEMKDDV